MSGGVDCSLCHNRPGAERAPLWPDHNLAGAHRDTSAPGGRASIGASRSIDAAHTRRAALYAGVCRRADRFAGDGGSVTSSTINVRGPCTPSTRLSSISLVAEGPEIKV